MRQCIYCKIKDINSSLMFFEFPKNKNLLELWYENMGFNLGLLPSKTMYLCSEHFTKDCIDLNNKVLLHDSVPTIFKKHMTSIVLINKHEQIIDKMVDESNVAGPSSQPAKRSMRTCNSIYRNITRCDNIQRSRPQPESHEVPVPEDFNSPATSRVCRICLDIDVKMYPMFKHNLSCVYERLTGSSIHVEDKLPQMFCWECVARLSSVKKFMNKVVKSQHMLAEIDGIITIGDIKAINRSDAQLTSALGIFNINDADSVYVEDIKDEIDDGNTDDRKVEIPDENVIEYINMNDDIADNNKDINTEIAVNDESNEPETVNNNNNVMRRKSSFKKKKKVKPVEDVSVKIESVDVTIENISNNEIVEFPEMSVDTEAMDKRKTSVASAEFESNSGDNVDSEIVKDTEIKIENTQVIDNEVEIFYTDNPEIIIINIDRVSENNDNEVHLESIDVGNEEVIGDEDGEEAFNNKDDEVKAFSENAELIHIDQKRDYSDDENKRVFNDKVKEMIGDDSDKKLVYSTDDDLESNVFDLMNYEDVEERKSNGDEVVKQKTAIEDNDKSASVPKMPPPLPDFNEIKLTYVEQIQEIQDRKESDAFKNAKYKCEYCYRGFGQEDVYQMHMGRHSKSIGKLECFICKMRFKSSSGLKKHLLCLHVIKYSCKWCPFNTYQRTYAQKHSEKHTEKIFKCEHCPRTFHKLTTYQGHLRLKHVSDYVCELCGFTFVTPRGIRTHKYTTHKYHDENTPLEGPHCDACDIKFLSEEAYTVHLKKSSKHTSNSELEEVQKQRVLKPRFSCELCDTILNRDNYVQHYRECHPDTSTLMCDQCGKIFNSLLLFKNHKCLFVDEVRQVVCEKCGLIFEKKIHLHVHRNQVHNHKGYKCKVCDKHFLTYDHCSRHTRYMHADHRAHKCDICLKFYKSRSNLKAHITHTHKKVPWPRRTRNKEQK